MKKPVFNLKGEEVGTIELAENIFGAKPQSTLLHEVTTIFQANQRLGTAHTKTRADVSGGGAKPWRQKGTGRARAGKASSPVRVGGGVAHGPHPRSYRDRVPQKVRNLALRSVFSIKASSGAVKVLQDFSMDVPKTKHLVEIAKAIEVDQGKTLILIDQHDGNIAKSCRNIPGLSVRPVGQVCTYDVVFADRVVFTESALGRAQGLWGAS